MTTDDHKQYQHWLAAVADARAAYAAWAAAPAESLRGAYVVYRAAADREEAAASTFLEACGADRSARRPFRVSMTTSGYQSDGPESH
jgi:hypothetical protein